METFVCYILHNVVILINHGRTLFHQKRTEGNIVPLFYILVKDIAKVQRLNSKEEDEL